MNGSIFHASGERAGTAVVRVRAEGLEKRHNIVVRLRESFVAPGSPSGIDTAFNGPVGDASTAPQLAYPEHDVVIPLNLAAMLFQWRSPLSNAWFHLKLEGTN